MKAEENKDKTFAYNPDAIKITYYKTDFLYWDKLPDFTEYATVDKIPKQKIYNYSDENTKENVGKKSLKEAGLIDDSYFAIEGTHEVGDIVGQTVQAGTEYDQTNPGDTTLEIQAIGSVLEYNGLTGKELQNKLSENGFGMYGCIYPSGKSASGSTAVQSVEVYDTDTDPNRTTPLEYFKKNPNDPENNTNLFFVITVAYPPTEAPAPAPSYDGGSYSAPSSGGSSGGGSHSRGGHGAN